MRLAILAFTVLALSGAAYAQDDNGGSGDNGAATTNEASSAEAPDPNDPFAIQLAEDEASCKLRGVDAQGLSFTCAGASGAPLARISSGGSADGSAYDSVEPDIVGNIR